MSSPAVHQDRSRTSRRRHSRQEWRARTLRRLAGQDRRKAQRPDGRGKRRSSDARPGTPFHRRALQSWKKASRSSLSAASPSDYCVLRAGACGRGRQEPVRVPSAARIECNYRLDRPYRPRKPRGVDLAARPALLRLMGKACRAGPRPANKEDLQKIGLARVVLPRQARWTSPARAATLINRKWVANVV